MQVGKAANPNARANPNANANANHTTKSAQATRFKPDECLVEYDRESSEQGGMSQSFSMSKSMNAK
jgi:hypothetical protein